MSKKTKLFCHTDLDGIGCAILAYMAFGESGFTCEDVHVEYCDYNNVNEKVEAFMEDKELFESYDAVYITDISVNDDVADMIDILDAPSGKVKLFDHHATALYLNKYDWCEVRVDGLDGVKTSGTELFFIHLLTNGYFDTCREYYMDSLERFVNIVRDYDTWRWKEVLGESEGLVCKQVNDLFHIYGRERFIGWSLGKIRDRLGRKFPNFDFMDNFLLEQKQTEIDIYVAQKNKQLVVVNDNFGYKCGVVFAERFFSELGNRLSELHPELDYIAMVDMGFGGVSYRTVKDDIDLGGEIAHSFGGGGHRKAAGSSFDVEAVRAMVVNSVFGFGVIR